MYKHDHLHILIREVAGKGLPKLQRGSISEAQPRPHAPKCDTQCLKTLPESCGQCFHQLGVGLFGGHVGVAGTGPGQGGGLPLSLSVTHKKSACGPPAAYKFGSQ